VGIDVGFSSPVGPEGPLRVTSAPGSVGRLTAPGIDFGVTQPGETYSRTALSEQFSEAVENLTASVVADAEDVFSVVSVTVYEVSIAASLPGHGPGETVSSVEVDQSNGVTPLAVAAGQTVSVVVQFAPTGSTPDNCSATLEVNGEGMNPVSVLLSASVAEVTLDVPAINVTAEQTAVGTVTVTLVTGAPTTATLTLEKAPGSTSLSPAGFVELDLDPDPTSVQLSVGEPATCTLTVTPGATTYGTYEFFLSGTAFDGAYSFGTTFQITVEAPPTRYYLIKSSLGNVMDIAGSSSSQPGVGLVANPQTSAVPSSQLWAFMSDPAGSGYYYIVNQATDGVVDIEGAAGESAALLGVVPRNGSGSGSSAGGNQLWFFVSDPQDPSYCRIVSALNGNVIDLQGGSAAPGTSLDSYPAKFIDAENQQWQVVGGEFPDVVDTVHYPVGWGNGNVNYLFDGSDEALTTVSVTINLTQEFSSSSNGYGFQLNCYPEQLSSVGPQPGIVWQQFAVYSSPGQSELYAIVQTWASAPPPPDPNFVKVNNIQGVTIAPLPSPTIPKGYSIKIVLTYSEGTALVSGAIFTVTDDSGDVVGAPTPVEMTSQPLAPVTNIQLNIVADYQGSDATITSGAGTITYVASSDAQSGLTVTQNATPGPGSVFLSGSDTGENANITYGPLPWPWSLSMTNVANQFVQLFEVTPAAG
jgi:hypothetical protein